MSTAIQATVDAGGVVPLARREILRAWVWERLLFGDLPRPSRRFGLLTITIGLPTALFVALRYPVFSASETWLVITVLMIVAFGIETRFWMLQGYGGVTNTISSAVCILGLLLCGPGFAIVFAFAMTAQRWIARPWTPPYRMIWNFSMSVTATVPSAFILAIVLPHGVVGPLSWSAYLLLVATLMTQSLGSVSLTSVMVDLSQGHHVRKADLLRQLLETMSLDLVTGAAVLLMALAWAGGGVLGLLLVLAAVMLPALIIVAPAVEVAWREVVMSSAAERRERQRQRALAGEIADEARVAYLDALTGLGNRLAFDDRLAHREAHSLLILADIVGLRAFNDLLGHDAGDDLLRAAANGLRASIRGRDRAYRLGGDEFALVLDSLPSLAVEAFLARVSARVAVEGEATQSLNGHLVRLRFGWADMTAVDPYAVADAMLTARHAADGATARTRGREVAYA